jgi:hypothetical protein
MGKKIWHHGPKFQFCRWLFKHKRYKLCNFIDSGIYWDLCCKRIDALTKLMATIIEDKGII